MMGLDVSAYRGLKKLDVVFDAHGEPIDPVTREEITDGVRFYANPDFPGRQGQIEDRAVYSYEDSLGGWSGGYGRYNRWREELAELAGWPLSEYEQYGRMWPSHAASAWAATEGPFWELINFSDCEGVIGAEVSAKLANDFAEHDEKARQVGGEFYEKYQEWAACFRFASDNGAVWFH